MGCGTVTPICGAGVPYGFTTDRPVSGDFDGDFKTDLAVWRPSDGRFYHYRSSTATAGNTPGIATTTFPWGITGDVPQPADYDGDKKTDYAIFRPSTGEWWIYNSLTGTPTSALWGTATDQPASSPYRISNP